MGVLRKSDVERMLTAYDDDPVGALTAAMRLVFDAPDLGWTELVKVADFTCATRIRLQAGEPAALDALVRELNETRTVTSDR
jgi:hypothetical protein